MTTTRFLILGPLQVVHGGREIPVRRGKLRSLLIMLLLGNDQVVSTDRLVNGLWSGNPPDTAVKTLQTYVSQLRTLLEPGRDAGRWGGSLATEHMGYRLLADADAVDARRFERLAGEGGELAARDPAAARNLLADGLRLWRGPALADVATEAFAEAEAARLEELRLTAVEQRVAADLALGRHELVVAELRELVRRYPLRESLWEHLMLALYRGGRQAQALRAYQDVRRILGDQLGLSPGPALTMTQERILRQDPTLSPPAAARLRPPPAPPAHSPTGQAERRRATVLHADVTGAPDLIDALCREVGRYGGTVIEADDATLVAVFGAPVTHEDDAERAVRACLAVRDRVAGSAAVTRGGVRAGIDTGEVHARPGGEGYLVSGPAVTGAAALAGRATSDRIVVGAATYEATRQGVRYAAVRHPDEVQDLWRVVDVADEPSRRPLSTTPLVGRTVEMGLLSAIWDRVRTARGPHLVTITGQPGIGKSRLAGDLVARLAGQEAVVLRSRCLPYGDAVFGPLARLVRQVVGVSENHSAGTVRWRVRDWLETHLAETEHTRIDEYLVAVLSLLGDITEKRASTVTLLRRFVEVVAAERPTVLLVDDLHWAHAETLDAIEDLAAGIRSVPLLIVTVGRPELFTARQGWGGGLPSHTSLTLEALPARQAQALARLLLSDRGGGEHEVRAIEAAAGGNPLFLEELAAWIAEGHDVSAVPSTVRAVIAARLDTLPAPERRVVVDAAVVGPTFWAGVLTHLGSAGLDELPGILDSLEMRGLIVRRPDSSIGDDPGLSFRHDLIAEVACDLIPPAERAGRHLAVAAYLESTGPAGPAPAVLAHHWKEAGDVDRAVTCLVDAAELANTGWERDRAVALFQQAMDLVVDTDRARWRAINRRRALALAAWAHALVDVDRVRAARRGE